MLYGQWLCSNYNAFYGEINLPLYIEDNYDPRIVLIIAPNGFGKTSFINAIKLALYGETARLHKDIPYMQYLKERINDKAIKEGKRKAWVAIEFVDSNDSNNFKKIIVKREWSLVTDSTVNEIVSISIDDQEQEFEDNDELKEFVGSIIPKELLQFFAFDAEEIRYTADDSNTNDNLTNDIAKVLTITDYENAKSRLKQYSEKKRTLRSSVTPSKLGETKVEIMKLEEIATQKENDLANLVCELEELEKKLRSKKKWLLERGYRDKDNRLVTEVKIDNFKHRKDEILTSFSECTSELLPYMIIFSEIEEVSEQLEKETDSSKKIQNYKNSVEMKLELMSVVEEKNIDPPLMEKQKEIIKNLLSNKWNKFFSIEEVNLTLLHHETLSKQEYINLNIELQSRLKQINHQVAKAYVEMEEYHTLSKQLKELEEVLQTLPTSEQFQKEWEALNTLNINIKEIENNIEIVKSEIQQHYIDIAQRQQEFSQLQKELNTKKELEERTQLADSIQKMLSEYTHLLKQHKSKDIKKYAKEMFNKLAHKKGMINEFEIDEETFEITLKDKDNKIIPKRRLSEGEKQIYGLSLTYALAKSSEKNFGFIIDTPFAKLDATHKQNMIDNFITNIGKQVIILAHDDELNDQRLEQLRKYVNKEFKLVSDTNNLTKIVSI